MQVNQLSQRQSSLNSNRQLRIVQSSSNGSKVDVQGLTAAANHEHPQNLCCPERKKPYLRRRPMEPILRDGANDF